MLSTNEDSMKAARSWAEAHLGDASWANDIIWAFEHPAEAMALLNEVDTTPETGYAGTNTNREDTP